jgi:pimeloyl-ACP methyl ester carboxylesterase
MLATFLLAATLTHPTLKIGDCTPEGVKARCGTLTVPEKAGSKRRLELAFVVLPATEKSESAVFPFAGGPGEALVDGAGHVPVFFGPLLRHHDVVLFDERGTGQSAPLKCDAAVAKHRHELMTGELMPLDFVRDCRAEVEKSGADLTAYTYRHFADDVEALRVALGYGAIDIFGGSYGTRAALTFSEKYPSSVRTLTLSGPVAPNDHGPLNFARDSQAALDRLVAACAADKACHERYPNFAAIVATTLPKNVSAGAYHEWLRSQLYSLESAAALPSILDALHRGDAAAFNESFEQYRKSWYASFPLFLSVTCMSDVRYIDPASIDDATKGTFLGRYRVDAQRAACDAWVPGTAPIVKVSKAHVPILMIVGDSDPVTPKVYADAIARDAWRSRTVVLANSAHSGLSACFVGIVARFVDTARLDKVDDACAAKIVRPAFSIEKPEAK